MVRRPIIAFASLIATVAWIGCGQSDGSATGDDQNVTATTCKIFNNQTGKQITKEELAKLNDPVAQKILEGDCPGSYGDALKKMKTNDADGCQGPDGLGSFLVSETAAFASSEDEAAAGGFRTVISKQCGGRGKADMLFSGFANASGHSNSNVEMIGRDATTGVFNYYEVIDDGSWVFYGNSFDFIGEGYTCKPSGFCVANNSKKASSPTRKSCASCHVSGGLIMKELASPWLHWTAGFPQGAQKVVNNAKDKLGDENQGENLEIQVVRPSFDPYNQKRIDFLAGKGAQELLRPVFCTMDVNLDSQLIGANLVVDQAVTFGFLQADNTVYGELKKEVGQKIVGTDKDDTAFEFTYPSRGAIDISYGRQLVNAKLIDNELMQDILNVDFTRPLFSGQRCALVDVVKGKTSAVDAKLASFAKESDATKKGALAAEIAKDLPALYAEALKGKTKPGEQKLLANLTDTNLNAAAHQKAATEFTQKCNARLQDADAANKKAAHKDFMTYASHVRAVMRKDVVGFNGQDLLEGRGRDDKMVVDNIPDNPNAFDPATCTLTLAP